jgi:hypothetical protein
MFSTMVGAVEIARMLPEPAMREKVLGLSKIFSGQLLNPEVDMASPPTPMRALIDGLIHKCLPQLLTSGQRAFPELLLEECLGDLASTQSHSRRKSRWTTPTERLAKWR